METVVTLDTKEKLGVAVAGAIAAFAAEHFVSKALTKVILSRK